MSWLEKTFGVRRRVGFLSGAEGGQDQQAPDRSKQNSPAEGYEFIEVFPRSDLTRIGVSLGNFGLPPLEKIEDRFLR
jgi:hypothetical protein